jgi:predicted aspartyl protease
VSRACALVLLAVAALPLITLAACASDPAPLAPGTCEVRKLSELPVTLVGRLPVVPVRIDGIEARMVLDTGADRLLVTEAALPRLHLSADRHRPGFSRGVNGTTSSFAASVERLILGSVDLGHRDADILPFVWPTGIVPPDGFLAGGILFIFDLDIDIPHRRVTLYYPRICPDGAAPWPVPSTALEAEPTMAGHAHLAVKATLEGREVSATIDTGAEISLVSRRTAALVGVDDAALAKDAAITTLGFGTTPRTARLHRFNELRVGGELLIGRVMAVADIPDGAGDMLLGEDWLLGHRIWLSFASRRVYVARSTTR